MNAWYHHARATSYTWANRPIPVPAEKEVLLRVAAAGLCHSDLHVLEGKIVGGIDRLEYIPGHEVSATAVQNGPGATAIVGSLYAVIGTNPCCKCAPCLKDFDNLCTTARNYIGAGRDGGFAEYLAVPQSALVPIPKGVSPAVAACATDAILTPYHAVRNLGAVTRGQTVAIIGLGGLGYNAAQIALVLGARVLATDFKTEAMEAAGKLGVEVMALEELLEACKQTHVDVVVDLVGNQSTLAASLQMVGIRGKVIVVGLAQEKFEYDSSLTQMKECTVQPSSWGTKKDLEEILQHLAAGRLLPQIHTAPLPSLMHWIEQMRLGRVVGRVAFLPE